MDLIVQAQLNTPHQQLNLKMISTPINQCLKYDKYIINLIQAKRECPIVPKHKLQNDLSPFSYNFNLSEIAKCDNNRTFGTKAVRKIDIRKCNNNLIISYSCLTTCSSYIERTLFLKCLVNKLIIIISLITIYPLSQQSF